MFYISNSFEACFKVQLRIKDGLKFIQFLKTVGILVNYSFLPNIKEQCLLLKNFGG